MTSPIGDGNGTRGGCRFLVAAFVLSLALTIAAVVAVVYGLGRLVDEPAAPQSTPSTSTRSTP